MVLLNPKLILRGISSVNFDKRDLSEAQKQFHRVTHLHLQNKKITTMANLDRFVNLTVLYLYENEIKKIQGLEGAINLEMLYLQRNDVDRVSGLTGCTKLRKLFLGYNAIQCLDGLDAMVELEELHVEHQRIKPTDCFMVDPMSLNTLSTCLQVLNVSGNNIDCLENFAAMSISTLIARENKLCDLDNAVIILGTMPNLRVLDLTGNPIVKERKYREKIIGYSCGLEILDEKEITERSRIFMQSFCRMKAGHLKRLIDTYGSLPGTLTTSTTSGLQVKSAERISSPMFKNRTRHQELMEQKQGPLDFKPQSLHYLLPPKLLKPNEMPIPQFVVLAPQSFLLNEPQPNAKNKNNNKSNISQEGKNLFRSGQDCISEPTTSRVVEKIHEPNLETYVHPVALVRSESMPEVKSDADDIVTEELTKAEAHYTQLIENDSPCSELAKVILGLHESPRLTCGGDRWMEQEKGISWTVLSPTTSTNGNPNNFKSTPIHPKLPRHLSRSNLKSNDSLLLQGRKAGNSTTAEQIRQEEHYLELGDIQTRQYNEGIKIFSNHCNIEHSSFPMNNNNFGANQRTNLNHQIGENGDTSNIPMVPIPVFQKSVYKLPAWPHILKMGSSEPRVAYFP